MSAGVPAADVASVQQSSPEPHLDGEPLIDVKASFQRWMDTGRCLPVDDALSPLVAAVEVEPPLQKHSALYIQNLTVTRFAQTRHRPDRHYQVNTAVAVPRALADTGAAPSIVTTDLLDSLPPDCKVSRDYDAATASIMGADGRPLRLLGTATICFQLNDVSFRHTFIVSE